MRSEMEMQDIRWTLLILTVVSLILGCVRFMFFFFQAEDGIRDYKVTGVQTCALPIWRGRSAQEIRSSGDGLRALGRFAVTASVHAAHHRGAVGGFRVRCRDDPVSTVEIGRASCRERV